MTRYVRLVGEATEAEGEILSSRSATLRCSIAMWRQREEKRREPSSLESKTDLESLAAQQGVSAVSDFDSLLGDFWPEEESADQFIASVREWRREGERRGNS